MNVSSAFVEFTFKAKYAYDSGQSGINKLLEKMVGGERGSRSTKNVGKGK